MPGLQKWQHWVHSINLCLKCLAAQFIQESHSITVEIGYAKHVQIRTFKLVSQRPSGCAKRTVHCSNFKEKFKKIFFLKFTSCIEFLIILGSLYSTNSPVINFSNARYSLKKMEWF
jgi:hypothetical protein